MPGRHDWKVLAVIGVLALAATPGARAVLRIQISEVNIYKFPFLTCRVVVLDDDFQPVRGLTAKNFELWENDLQVTDFEVRPEIAPAALATTMDYSASMDYLTLFALEWAVIDFINMMAPNEEMSLIKFSSIAQVVQPRTSNKALLIEAVFTDWLYEGAHTALFDAIYLGVEQNVGARDRGVVLAFTDGGENASKRSLEETLAYCVDNQNVIYSIGYPGYNLDEKLLQYLAAYTGGFYYFSPDEEMMKYVYAFISGSLHTGYEIEFRTLFPRIDGTERKLLLHVKAGGDEGWRERYYRGPAPPAVGLTDFEARPGIGLVHLRWRTETETDNAGFYVLRSERPDGPFEPLNEELIWGHGTTVEPHWYGYFDHTAQPGRQYWYALKDVEFDGDYNISEAIPATPVAGRSNILLGGIVPSRIRSSEGGLVTVAALLDDPGGNVELYFDSLPTGVLLNDSGRDGDLRAGDGVFTAVLRLPPGAVPPGRYLLELVSTRPDGVIDGRWPYLAWIETGYAEESYDLPAADVQMRARLSALLERESSAGVRQTALENPKAFGEVGIEDPVPRGLEPPTRTVNERE